MSKSNRGHGIFRVEHLAEMLEDLPQNVRDFILDVAEMRYNQKGHAKNFGVEWRTKRDRWQNRVDKLLDEFVPEIQNIDIP